MNILFANIFYIYLVIINLISGAVFAFDKNAAKNGRRRIPEKSMHLLEMAGGVFVNFVLMYSLRHKNRKFSYWSRTWFFLLAWAVGLFYIFYQ